MATTERSVLVTNLAALRLRNPGLARRLAAFDAASSTETTAPELVAAAARNGALTLRIVPDGTLLHSAYDPLREGRTRAATLQSNATVVICGLGAGHLPRALLALAPITTIVAAEPSTAAWFALLRCVPLDDLLSDERVHCVCGSAELTTTLQEVHVSAVRDGVGVAELPAWCDLRALQAGFQELRAALQAATSAMALDHGTMRLLGRAWFANSCANLRRCVAQTVTATWRNLERRCRGTTILVAAAGPSLDTALPQYAAAIRNGTATLIATDTALGACLDHGLMPRAVVSIDAQRWTYLHTLGRPVLPTVLVADVAVVPAMVRRFESWVPISSGHPLTEHARLAGAPLRHIMARGRNVTVSAVAVAQSLSDGPIQLIGADFAYPGGTTYARGTYQHRLAALRASRTHPGETFFQEQLWSTSGLYRTESRTRNQPAGAAVPTYRSPVLDGYGEMARQQLATPRVTEADGDHGWSPTAWFLEHRAELQRLCRRFPELPLLTTATILSQIGPIGRAYLPLSVWLHSRSDVDSTAPKRLSAAWSFASTILKRRFCR